MTGYYSVRYFALIGSKTPLKGLYKVIDQKNYYHIVYFENGTEIPSSYLNVVKYYYLNKIYKIDLTTRQKLINIDFKTVNS